MNVIATTVYIFFAIWLDKSYDILVKLSMSKISYGHIELKMEKITGTCTNLEQVDRLSAMNDILCNIYMIIKNHFMKYKQKITRNHVTYYLLHLLIPEKWCLIQDFLKMSAVNRSTSNSYVFHQQVNSHCTSQEVDIWALVKIVPIKYQCPF